MTEPYTATVPKAPPAPQHLARDQQAWYFDVALALRGDGGGEALPGWPEGPQLQVVRASAVVRYPARRRKRDDVATAGFLAAVMVEVLYGPDHWIDGKWLRRPGPGTKTTIGTPGGVFAFEGLEISEDIGPGRTLIRLEYTR